MKLYMWLGHFLLLILIYFLCSVHLVFDYYVSWEFWWSCLAFCMDLEVWKASLSLHWDIFVPWVCYNILHAFGLVSSLSSVPIIGEFCLFIVSKISRVFWFGFIGLTLFCFLLLINFFSFVFKRWYFLFHFIQFFEWGLPLSLPLFLLDFLSFPFWVGCSWLFFSSLFVRLHF